MAATTSKLLAVGEDDRQRRIVAWAGRRCPVTTARPQLGLGGGAAAVDVV